MKRVHQDFSRDLNLEQFKKPKHCTEVNNLGVDCSASESNETPPNVPIPSSDAIDFSDPCSVRKGLDSGRFGSVTKDIETLHAHKMQIMGLLSESLALFREETSHVKQPSESWLERPSKPMGDVVVIDLEDESGADGTPTSALKAIIIDSDEEDKGVCSTEGSSLPLENALSDHQTGESILKDEEELLLEQVKDHLDGNVWVKETELSMEIHSEVEENGDANLVEKHVNKTPFIDDNNVHEEANSTIKKHEYVTVREHGDDRAFAEDTRIPVETGTETVREHGNDRAFAEDILVETGTETVRGHEDDGAFTEDTCLPAESGTETKKNNIVYVRVEDEENHQIDSYDDGLEDAWNEMSMALELSKAVAADHSPNELQVRENEVTCEHYFILKDDLGYVCRICGVIDRGIETIFEFQYGKAKRSSRTYMKSGNSIDKKSNGIAGVNICDDDERPNEVYAHPRHSKKMKPHQKEGFDFLVSNLVGDDPGGCILAHAPGSGKTFMVISFVHSFLAKYPNARPLVVLPKGIVSTWKKEFQIWQIEDFPLYDTAKADGRVQQLEVLKQWVENKSILFLSYQQFSSIVCDADNNEVSTSCQDILLKVPSILVLDEGHTPRNDNTDIFQALAKVQTPRKVVLSGTLYQNHVQEVFNILNLVRTNFLKSETARAIVTRIRSKVDMSLSSARKRFKASSDAAFFEIVEHTLQKDKDSRRKASIIHDLRELTHKVLHYYKGDFLDELPGLVDFTVVLNLSSKQMREVEKVKKLRANFQANYLGSAIYLHPMLLSCSDKGSATDDKMDELLQNLNLTEGVKAKFFLNMLSLCEAKKEKLLVFSQYLVPLKFLERLAMKEKGWSLGKEIFVISGKSSSDARELSMDRFNNSPVAKVFFGSIKACGEGISLVGASRILIMDIHLNPSVTRQAIGRAFRPGQTRKVYVYRLVAADSPEVEDYATCSKKELIAKTWFESKANYICKDFEVETLAIKDCGDEFLEGNPVLEKDIKVLYRR